MPETTISGTARDYSNDLCVPGDGADVANFPHDGAGVAPKVAAEPAGDCGMLCRDTAEEWQVPYADYSGKDTARPPRPKAAVCAEKRVEAYNACVRDNRIADEVECSPGDRKNTAVGYYDGKLHYGDVDAKITTPDGRTADCRDYLRHGENAKSVANQGGETHVKHRSATNGTSRSDGSSFGGPYFQSSGGTSTMKQNTIGESNGTNSSHTVTEHRSGAEGWEGDCQKVKRDTFKSCMESE